MLNNSDAESLANALISFTFDLCMSVPNGLPAKTHSKSQHTQNYAGRVLTASKLESSHVTFTPINGLAPQYVAQLLCPYTPAHSFQSAGTGLLVLPRLRLSSMGGRAVFELQNFGVPTTKPPKPALHLLLF